MQGQLAAAGGTLPRVGWEFMTNLYDGERRLGTRPVTEVRRSRRQCRAFTRRRRVVVKQLLPPLLQVLEHGQLELLRVGQPLQPSDLGGQFQGLRDETLIFAIEEETDLTKRLNVLFLRQFDHARRI
jgi:hypothetical protein